MIREQGRIVRTQAGRAWIEARSRLDCPRCAEGRGCGGGLLGRWLGDRLNRVEAANPDNHPSGSWVELGLDERDLFIAALLVYLPPLFGLLLGATLAQVFLGLAEGWVVLLALLGLALGLLPGRALLSGGGRDRRFAPAILRRLSGPPEGCQKRSV
ncbi:sigma-E factor negative regulatory protein RseC [Natronospira proteinivora]|uniref:Sigma-E factor negative regulatory protein RseC n=1 Tax=Natronospira proteinivora TaxID=1807133 RepID=A0ABT1G5U6_9GAMM|nr:SoxR reducing system RseC family protein [Natronospira proteinivora]MCP1726671.1 sigma-E factor negative regulatory protein RseC [Natronospira proteinivora]